MRIFYVHYKYKDILDGTFGYWSKRPRTHDIILKLKELEEYKNESIIIDRWINQGKIEIIVKEMFHHHLRPLPLDEEDAKEILNENYLTSFVEIKNEALKFINNYPELKSHVTFMVKNIKRYFPDKELGLFYMPAYDDGISDHITIQIKCGPYNKLNMEIDERMDDEWLYEYQDKYKGISDLVLTMIC